MSGTTVIAALVPRRRAVVAGEVESVLSTERRPWVGTDAVLDDGTGTLVLRFMGRVAVPGIAAGRRLIAKGTPALEDGVLLMRNPLYSFVKEERVSGTSW